MYIFIAFWHRIFFLYGLKVVWVILFLYEHAVAFVRVVDEITPRGYRMPLDFNAHKNLKVMHSSLCVI